MLIPRLKTVRIFHWHPIFSIFILVKWTEKNIWGAVPIFFELVNGAVKVEWTVPIKWNIENVNFLITHLQNAVF